MWDGCGKGQVRLELGPDPTGLVPVVKEVAWGWPKPHAQTLASTDTRLGSASYGVAHKAAADLGRVPGIGPATIDAIRDRLVFEEPDAP